MTTIHNLHYGSDHPFTPATVSQALIERLDLAEADHENLLATLTANSVSLFDRLGEPTLEEPRG